MLLAQIPSSLDAIDAAPYTCPVSKHTTDIALGLSAPTPNPLCASLFFRLISSLQCFPHIGCLSPTLDFVASFILFLVS